ncbi:hypothetical protein LQZ18_03610 [Lachnospiraceae bacterium ZAX-1]
MKRAMKNKLMEDIGFEDINALHQWYDKLQVPKTENVFVNLIDSHAKEIKERKKRSQEKYNERLLFLLRSSVGGAYNKKDDTVLTINVSEKIGKRIFL